MRALAAALLISAGLRATIAAPISEVDYKSVLPVDAKTCSDTDGGENPAPCVWIRDKPIPTGPTLWKMWKFSPVEIVSYRGDWAKVRDFEGDEGWIQKSFLSDTPTVCVRVKEGKIRSKPGPRSRVEWVLDRGYPLRLFGERGEWYEVSDLEEVSGWIHRGSVWGAPPPSAYSQ